MLQKTLSPLEQEAMNIVWELKECSIRDVLKQFNHEKKLAYTTAATLLQRLFEKGLVNRNNQNTILSYTPKVSKEMYGKKMAKSFIQSFISSFGEIAIVSFAESIDKLPKEKRDYLLELLEKQHENK